MDLFGRQGGPATTIARIEAAAGPAGRMSGPAVAGRDGVANRS
jgi:hypothetical protein